MALRTAPIVAGSLIGGYLVARETKKRQLGGVVLAAGGVIAAREWAARVGTAKMFALLAVYLLGFGASHPLAKKIGAWPAVFTAAGASAVAAAWALLFTGLFELFLHADLHTPRWLGWIVQRPEMHRVHHAHGHHAQNYGLPIWDALFGTLDNPREWPDRCGFDEDKSAQVHAMLMGRDVHRG